VAVSDLPRRTTEERVTLTDKQIRDQLWKASWMTQGRGPADGDYAYWVPKWAELEARGLELGDPEYAFNRLLGKGATGADVPPFGAYANPPTSYRSVPPSPWADPLTVVPPPNPSPDPPPNTDPSDGVASGLAPLLAAVVRIVDGVETTATAMVRIANALEQLNAKGVKVRF
jgi:hypothetical protein